MCKRLSIREKQNVLEMLKQPGATQSSVAKSLGISQKTVHNVVSHRTTIGEFLNAGASEERCHLKTNEKFKAVNEATLAWFTAISKKHGEFPMVDSIVRHTLPRIVQTRHFKTVLDQARRTGIVDLSHLALGNQDCATLCDCLLSHGQIRVITKLSLSGNGLTTIVHSEAGSSVGILNILVQMAPHLTSLHFSSNLLGSHDVLAMLNELSRHMQSDDAQPVKHQNSCITGNSFDGAICWTELIHRLTVAFPKLNCLHLTDCSLDTGSDIESAIPALASSVPKGLSMSSAISALAELDLSWNSHLSTSRLALLLEMPSLAGLRSLRLRGCSTIVGILPIPTNMPVDQNTLASCAWFPYKVDSSTVSHHMIESSGDRLVHTLAQAMSKGHFRLQMLDLGYCQLTTHCLDNLRSLHPPFPGSSCTRSFILVVAAKIRAVDNPQLLYPFVGRRQ
ncbi:unnamed protein product [Echinostoma caproni]|uniref:HTH_38 domain-containing protein n=1 Tax=Echinostoma caproni TaxID=27848 RepID=A0A183ASX7_9TREM|nr:unnamed protein product [Echinostoma caproni]